MTADVPKFSRFAHGSHDPWPRWTQWLIFRLESPLLLAATQPKAPITQYAQTLPQLGLPMPRRKALRPPKERLPVATTIDPVQVRNPPTPVPLTPVQPAPAPTAQAVPLTFPGGRHDGTSIPPDTSGAVGPAHVFNPLNNNVWYFDRNGAKLFDLPLDSFWTGLLQKTYNAFGLRPWPSTLHFRQRGRRKGTLLGRSRGGQQGGRSHPGLVRPCNCR